MTTRGRPRKPAPKRANGEGSVTSHKGRWRVQVTIGVKANGQPNRIDRLFPNEEEAHAELAALRQQYFDHNATGVIPTVGGIASAWVEAMSGTWAESRVLIVGTEVRNHIVGSPTIGHLPANRLSIVKVEAWLQHLADAGLTWPTIRTYKQHLSSAFRWAMLRNPHVRSNPVALVKSRPKNVAPSKPKTWLTLDEAQRLIAYCQQPHEAWGPFFLTSAMLGLRPGETFAITPRAIDFDAGTVHIGWALKRRGDVAVGIGPTKNSRTDKDESRTVGAPPIVLDALRRQIETIELARMVHSEEWSDRWGDLVFVATKADWPSRPGEVVVQSNVRTNLDRICEAAGVRRVTPYELRHSCASILLHRKVHPATVADMLGTSERMLREHYRHLMDPIINAGAEAWAEILTDPDT